MFERYSEKARRIIFFARYEANQFGSPTIEAEHLLLGVLRDDKALTRRLLPKANAVEAIRSAIERRTNVRETVSTSVDLPLSDECKRILAYTAEESDRFEHRIIGPEHLVLGILREERCFAAELLHKHGVFLVDTRKNIQEYGVYPENLARGVQERARPFASVDPIPSQGMLPLGFPVNTVRVSDVAASTAFYARLGLRPVKETPAEGMAVLSNGPFSSFSITRVCRPVSFASSSRTSNP